MVHATETRLGINCHKVVWWEMNPPSRRVVIVGSNSYRYNAKPGTLVAAIATIARNHGNDLDVVKLPHLASLFAPEHAAGLREPMGMLIIFPDDPKFWGLGLVALAARRAERVVVVETRQGHSERCVDTLRAWGHEVEGPATTQQIEAMLAPASAVMDLPAHTTGPGWRPHRPAWPQDETLPGAIPRQPHGNPDYFENHVLTGPRGRHGRAVDICRGTAQLNDARVRVLLDSSEALEYRFQDVVTHLVAPGAYSTGHAPTDKGANLIAMVTWVAEMAPTSLWNDQPDAVAELLRLAGDYVAQDRPLIGALEELAEDEFTTTMDGARTVRLHLAGALVACGARALSAPPADEIYARLRGVIEWMNTTRVQRVQRARLALQGMRHLTPPLNMSTYRYNPSVSSGRLARAIVPSRTAMWGPTMAAIVAGDLPTFGELDDPKVLTSWESRPIGVEGLGMLAVRKEGWAQAFTHLWELWREPRALSEVTMAAIASMTASHPPRSAEDALLWEALLPRVRGKRVLRAVLSGISGWPIVPSHMHDAFAAAIDRANLHPEALAALTVLLSPATDASRETRLGLRRLWGNDMHGYRIQYVEQDLLPTEVAIPTPPMERGRLA